jgi:hypothetical protein
MRGSEPLVTVSMTDISVLDSEEVAHLYPQVMILPICHGVMNFVGGLRLPKVLKNMI